MRHPESTWISRAAPKPAPAHAHPGGSRRAWPVLRRIGIAAFALVVVSLLVWQARRIDWTQVQDALRGYGAPTLLAAVALAALSHGLYSCFDLVGRHYVGHEVAARHVMRAAFVSYAFNLNMGTLVGAVGMRMRLYSRLGLDAPDIARIVGLSLVTNWSGYLLLAGGVFASGLVDLPEQWRIGDDALQGLGFVLVATAAGYLWLCHSSSTRSWSVRGHEIMLPGPGVAAVQIVLSMANWSVMAAIVWLLLRPQGDTPPGYGAVLATLLVGCVAGVLAKVPAGLGVLEAVFIAMLGHRLAEHQLLAGLLVYRAVYYLLPLAMAAITYGVLEWRSRHPRKAMPR
jgi:uncharacterized membrane protein YbhN (UPF0104 family)